VANVPPRLSTKIGRDAAALVEKAGLTLNPWQAWVLEESLAEGPDGLWSAGDVGLVVSRQNGKGEIIIARQLVGLFMLDEPLQVYTSHIFTTTKEMFFRLREALRSYKPFANRVAHFRVANGEVGVELKSGERIRFLARTAGSGRGFSVDGTLYLDEAMHLSDTEQDSLLPTLTAAPNPQVWYVGSAGVGEPSRVFSRIRRRGMAGDDERLFWAEWSIPEDADPDDESLWHLANPGLGHGQVTTRTLRGYRDNMSPEGFAREYLSVGDWPADDGEGGAIPWSSWESCRDPRAAAAGSVAFAVAVSPDRARSCIVAVGADGDRLAGEITGQQTEDGWVEDHRPGTSWVPDRLVELRDKWSPCAITLAPGSPAGSLIPDLEAAGIETSPSKRHTPGSLVLMTRQQEGQACGALFDDVVTGTLAHRGQSTLNDSVRCAKWRPMAESRIWDSRVAGDITPLQALTNARWAFEVFGPVTYDLLDSVL
jgi:hypothetical protein